MFRPINHFLSFWKKKKKKSFQLSNWLHYYPAVKRSGAKIKDVSSKEKKPEIQGQGKMCGKNVKMPKNRFTMMFILQ